jgi:hypothetical protein
MALNQQEGDVMTTQEAARELKCSPATVLRLARAGTLTPINPPSPVLKRPRRLLFRAADVLALAAPHLDAAPPRLLAEEPPGYDPHA